MNFKKTKTEWLLSITFAIVGLSALIMGIFFQIDNEKFLKTAIESTAAVFMAAGLIFFVIGGGMILFTIKKEKKFQLLKKLGKKIEANIDDISINERYSVNGRHPYKITCSYFDSVNNKTHVFNSENIWFDIKAVVENNKILTIDVYVDQSDESKYFVDVEDFRKYYEQN